MYHNIVILSIPRHANLRIIHKRPLQARRQRDIIHKEFPGFPGKVVYFCPENYLTNSIGFDYSFSMVVDPALSVLAEGRRLDAAGNG